MTYNFNKMLTSIKTQTINFASNIKLPVTLKPDSCPKNEEEKIYKWPSLLEQLQWPLLFPNWPNAKSDQPNDEEDIIDKFIKVIQAGEDEENAMSTFYNHPQRRRTDREEIRRKLAMGTEDDDVFNDGNLKKPSLQSRLKNGKNLQICFMNETASDCESQCSDTESTQDRIDDTEAGLNTKGSAIESESRSMDFVTQQARLQAEARLALSQAKEMARMQMEIEKQNQKKSPITEIVRDSFNKIGFPFPASKRRMSRQILTDMNVAQLQVIVNDLHTQIEGLNEDLVGMLLTRDDLHMEQDSMLVDIEDLTKHLGAQQRPDTISISKGIKNIRLNKTDSSKTQLNSIPSKTLKLKAMVNK